MSREYINPSALLRYWKNGSEDVAVHADPCKPDEAALPFHVLITSDGIIPLSALVFARDEAHAKHRVLSSIRECIAGEHGGRDHLRTWRSYGNRLLAEVESGKMAVHARSYDKDLIAANVIWASNGGML